MDKQVHVLMVPLPAQGHVKPFMELSHRLADFGVKVTFVNTELIHAQLVAASQKKTNDEHSRIHLVSVSDGMEPGDDRSNFPKFTDAMSRVMRPLVEDLIKKIDDSDDKITCVIADPHIEWVLEVAEKMGVKRAAFWPASVGILAADLQIPMLIEAGIIDENGTLAKKGMIKPSLTTPAWAAVDFMWNSTNHPMARKVMFELSNSIIRAVKPAQWILCNSIYELEPASFDSIPGILSVGPLLETNRFGQPAGDFWQEDSTCLSWLDEQPMRSVIYVAFGSTTIFNLQQIEELAHGLELVDQPFLWVVRPGLVNGVDTDGFRGIISQNGKVVSWAPQQKVLAHPSIACFLSHCGWNSTIDGLSLGVPFLCWPNMVDQFKNESYICDDWKIGLRLNPNENGIISRAEIKKKVEQLLCNVSIKAKALELRELAATSISEGGSSWKNLKNFIEQIKMCRCAQY